MVKVRVPATTSNIGTGFDILGLSLNLYNEFEAEIIAGKDIIVEYDGDVFGVEKLEKGKNSLIYKSFISLFKRYGEVPEGIFFRARIGIPVFSGLGSSATAVLGGLLLARELLKRYYGKDVSNDVIYSMGIEFEGHPDNVTPAFYGGFTLSYANGSDFSFVKLPFPDDFRIVVISPKFYMKTKGLRKILPKHYDKEVAVRQMSRLALLIRAFYEKDFSLLKFAVDDLFHEPYRGKFIPGFYDVKKAGYDNGALAVFLSGAGSSIAAICNGNENEVASAMKKVFDKKRIESRVFILSPDYEGAKFL